jgi:hypothetical protein
VVAGASFEIDELRLDIVGVARAGETLFVLLLLCTLYLR